MADSSPSLPCAAPISLKALLAEREKLDAAIGKALEREYPVGSIVIWRHGLHLQTGRVTEHWGATLRARNTTTGKYKDLTAQAVQWYEEHPHA